MDVCLVLLVIFMSVAPSVMSGIDVSVPPGSQSETVSRLASMNPVTVSFLNNGSLFVGPTKVSSPNLLSEVNRRTKGYRKTPIFIRADRQSSYGSVVMLMERLHNAGYSNTILVTEPYNK